MIRKKTEKDKFQPLIIDLDGPSGNVFVLLGTAKNLAKRLGYDSFEQKMITDQMKSGDYEVALSVFDFYFGDYVILERS